MRKRVLAVLPLAVVLGLTLVMADGGANHQTKQSGAIKLGTSGGNVNDISSAFCCSGTLGALVQDGSGTYILSNNHVLGLSGNASVGDDISQPGLIDVGCRASQTTTVANFTLAAPFGSSNVDAALARVVSGAVSSSGEILDVGVPSSGSRTAAANMQVAKSGRTTGFTCGNVTSTSTDVTVQYQAGCNQGKKFTVTYTNQVVVGGGTFSAGGDSGSLIVEASSSRPVALLYAGSSTTTIGNPVADVTSALGITFVGGPDHPTNVACPSGGGGGGGGGKPCKGKKCSGGGAAQQARVTMEQALAAKRQYAPILMQDDAVQGVGVGLDDDGEPVVVIYLEMGRMHRPLPEMMLGVRSKIVVTDRFRAYGWNEKLMPAGACKGK